MLQVENIAFKMKFRFYVFLILVVSACSKETKFNSETWKNAGGENITLEIRANMVSDLIMSETLLDKNKSEIIELIDTPSRLNEREVETVKYFAVQEKYGWDIDPEEMTFLKIKFNEEGKSISLELYSTK